MQDRVVNTNPRRYELVPQVGTGSHGGAYYDVYIGYTPDVAGTPLKESVLFDDALCNSYGLNVAQTDYTATDFPSPSHAFRDVWKFIYPVGTIFESTTLATANAVSAWFGGGTWQAWGAGKFSVAYSSGDTDFGTVEATGGNKGLQKHTHAVNHGHTSDDSGTLTTASNTIGLASSTVANHNHTTPNHTHTTGNDSPLHTHTWSDTATTSIETSHTHSGVYDGVDYFSYNPSTGHAGLTSSSTKSTGSGTDHTHSVSVSGTTVTPNTYHQHSIASSGAGTSGDAGTHNHTIEAHTHTIAGHTHTIASASFTSSENTQTGGAVAGVNNGNLPPYIVCYRYIRTA